MSYYAQTNYKQLQGKTVNGVKPRYSIHDIGCFITSFCNLLSRFGTDIDPDAMDNALAAKNLYVDVDDGVYDDVGWSTLCAYDPTISIAASGKGAPTSNNSIVKFIYNSFQTGKRTTHFCLVKDAKAGTIIDSWDGVVKPWSHYGGPVEYASYVKTKPQPVTPAQGEDMAMTADFVTKMYQFVGGRTPTKGEVDGQVESGTPASLLSGFIANHDTAVERLTAQVTAQDSQLKSLNDVVLTLQKNVDSLQAQLGQADDDNAELKTEVEGLKTRQGELNKIIQVQQTQLLANNCTTTISIKQAVQVLVQAFRDWIK